MGEKMKHNVVLASWLVVCLTGCAVHTKSGLALEARQDSESFAKQIILEKSLDAVREKRELASTTAEIREQILSKQAALDLDEVDIDYLGDPRPLLEAISYRYGYKYIETGKRREDIKTINIRVHKLGVIEVLRDVGYQIEGEAVIALNSGQIVLRPNPVRPAKWCVATPSGNA